MPPFTVQDELCNDLSVGMDSATKYATLVGKTNLRGVVCVPGHPLVAANDQSTVRRFLQQQFLTKKLDDLSQFFFFVATPDSSHINPLHEHIVRRRTIVATENPGQHLLWYENRLFVKPVPSYLLSHTFWERYLDHDTDLEGPALGYVRTYAYLIQTSLDYSLALEHKLLPSNLTNGDFERVLYFFDAFRSVADEQVNARYHYGELRLSRINWIGRIFRLQFFYYDVHGPYSQYFGRFLTPLIFVFGTVSVFLSAMQVIFAIQQLEGVHGQWRILLGFGKWYSVLCMVMICMVSTFFPLLFLGFLLVELMWATRLAMKRMRDKGRGNWAFT